MTISELAAEIAAGEIGVHEQGGNNRGPRVEQYLRAVGLEAGNPWCAAFVFWCFEQAAQRLGVANPVPKTGSSVRLWQRTEPYCRDSNPKVGNVYVLNHGDNLGHVGIVTLVDPEGVPSEISGNTTEKFGGRAGNCVAQHTGTPEVTHGGVLIGYLDYSRAAQAPDVA